MVFDLRAFRKVVSVMCFLVAGWEVCARQLRFVGRLAVIDVTKQHPEDGVDDRSEDAPLPLTGKLHAPAGCADCLVRAGVAERQQNPKELVGGDGDVEQTLAHDHNP